MRYTLIHDKIALDALARFWMTAPDPQAVTDASDEIDQLLMTIPDQCGVPFGHFRRLTLHPLEVLYHVSPSDCMVRVLTMRLLS
jgi:hypothetical protein